MGSSTVFGDFNSHQGHQPLTRTVWWSSKNPSVSTWLHGQFPIEENRWFSRRKAGSIFSWRNPRTSSQNGWKGTFTVETGISMGQKSCFRFSIFPEINPFIHLGYFMPIYSWWITAFFNIFFSYFSTFFYIFFHIFIRFCFCFQILPIFFFPFPQSLAWAFPDPGRRWRWKLNCRSCRQDWNRSFKGHSMYIYCTFSYTNM